MKILEEDPPLATEHNPPWLVDMFLYPVSAAGMVHLAIFCLGPLLLGFVSRLVLSRIPFGMLIAMALYLLLAAYALYYLACCLLDSSKGGRRAPDITVRYAPDKSDLLSQFFLVLGSMAICFWPGAVYYALTRRIDLVFWLLSACGVFLFPMALLAGVLFDAIHALNPVFLIASIFKTLPKYFGLVLFYCVLGAIVAGVMSDIRHLSAPQDMAGMILYPFILINYFFSAPFILKAIPLVYLGMIGAYLLGKFYWWHKDKLGWGL